MNGFVNYYSSSVMEEGVVRGLGLVTYGTLSLYSGQLVFPRNSNIARNKQKHKKEENEREREKKKKKKKKKGKKKRRKKVDC